jgi:type I restriction enzyme, S subunit
MIEGLKPYPEYKDSGHRLLGQVPRRWSLRPLCRVATPKSECGRTDLELLSVYLHRGVIRYSESGGQVHKPSMDLSKYQVVEPGDFVLNNQQAWRGSIGVSKYQGIVSPAYVVMKLSPTLAPDYANYLFRSPAMVAQYVVASRGVGDIQRNLYYPDLRGSAVVVPSPDEQAAIARFLDHANGKIDGFIRAKRKLIGLLNEQKQAIIHNAVTRGLNADVPLKPSGIPWLGDIPMHWEVLRAKYVFHEMDERSKVGNEEQLSVSHITGVTPRSQKNITMFKAESYVGHKICRPGDLAVNTMWAWMAALGVSKHEGIISPGYAVYRQRRPERLLSDYADHLLRIAPYKLNYLCRSTGLRPSRLRLYPDEFFKIPIIIPPKDEQQLILDSIAVETSALTTAIARTNREIALMQEYRTRLTADIVTGKLDVRAAAAKLPDLPVETTNEPLTDDEPLEEFEVEDIP